MILLPVLFFAVVEIVLRVADVGDTYPLFIEVDGHADYLRPNPEVGRRYFARTSVVPSPPHDVFRAQKDDGVYRIFVQGASTAAGFPYGHGGAFSRMLQQRLQRTFPDRPIEVVNTSMAAVNSYTLLDLVDEITAHRPDAVLVYSGHNEFYGALGVGSTESIGPTHRLVRWYLAIDHFRIVQLLRRGLTRLVAGAPSGRPPGATLMEEMARERSIPLDSPLFAKGLSQFRSNLSRLLCRYRDAGVPVYVGTLVSNERDQPPFDSGLSPATDAEAWGAAYERAVQLVADGDTTAALGVLDELIHTDSLAAEAFYARARLLDGLGRNEAARSDYVAAKDRDRLRFRAPEAANDIVRDAAASCGARVVDTQRVLADASPGGIVGKEMMLEHLHPNVDGYFLLADAFYEGLRAAEQIGSWNGAVPADVARSRVLVTPLDTTLAAFHVRRLRNNWPFQPPGVTRPDTLQVDHPLEALALRVLQGEETWLSATAAAGAYFEGIGDYDEAFRVARALIQEEPYRAHPYLLAGHLLVKRERWAAAFGFFQEAEHRQPSAEARRMMGHALLRGGRAAEAVPYLRDALELSSRSEATLFDLAVAYAETDRQEEARSTAEQLYRLYPESDRARHLMARLSPGSAPAPSDQP